MGGSETTARRALLSSVDPAQFVIFQRHIFQALSYWNKPLIRIKPKPYEASIYFESAWELDPAIATQIRTRYGLKEVSDNHSFYYRAVIPGAWQQ